MIPRIIAWLQRHLPNHCLLCLATTRSALALCQACIQDLPWRTGESCLSCGLMISRHCEELNDEAIQSSRHCERSEAIQSYKACGHCLKHPPSIDQAWCAWHYLAPINHFVHQLKFHQQLIYAQLMGRLMAERLKQTHHPLPEAILPVPLHKKRLRERGFNQAAEIAKQIARALKLPYEPRLVQRHKATAQQARLPAAKRKQNLNEAFSVVKPIPYKHIALVDDVMTTGTTLNALAMVLKRHGVPQVDTLCAARVGRKQPSLRT